MPIEVVQLLVTLIQLYSMVLLARIVLSWIPNISPANPIVAMLHQLTEPVLEPVRRAMPPLGMFDISPILVFIGLHILSAMIRSLAEG